MKSAFRHYFNTEVWNEGTADYQGGRVIKLTKINNKWMAALRGITPYMVTFNVHPFSMNCTCAYAKEGNKCKHMVAALLSYESENPQNTDEIETTAKSRKNITFTTCEWYSYVKNGLSPSGDFRNLELFHRGISLYFDSIAQERLQSNNTFANDLLILLTLLNKSYSDYMAPINRYHMQCLINLDKIRTTYIKKQKDTLDKQVLQVMLDLHCKQYLLPYVLYYFNTDEDIPLMERILIELKQAETPFSSIIKALEQTCIDLTKLEELCLNFSSVHFARMWLSNYYKKTEQCEKGITLLEPYSRSASKKKEEYFPEQIDLLYFYTKICRIPSKDILLKKLLEIKDVNKTDLFTALKDGMNEIEWNISGKKILSDWAFKRAGEECYDVFVALDAADMMLEKLAGQGFSIAILNEYFTFLSSYDEGVVYLMYKLILQNDIEQYSYNAREIAVGFFNDYPTTKSAKDALKVILIELKEHFAKTEFICTVLEEVEEHLYEGTA